MSDSVFSNFGNVVSDVLSKSKTDSIIHVLVITYEFDEQQLVNLVCSRNLEEDFELRQLQLKILSNIRPLVIYDAHKSNSFSKVPQFLELHPFKTHGFACHHSKGYLIVTEKSVKLVIGSFNLTATGLFRNREVFEDFHWNAHELNRLGIMKEWTDFLQLHYAKRLKSSSQSALLAIIETLNNRYAAWSTGAANDAVHLLYSGYDNESNGLTELRHHWDRWFAGSEPDSLIAVSPFFDESPHHKSLASDLQELFPAINAMTLITDKSIVGSLCKAHFGSITNNELLLIPDELNEPEQQRIEQLARQTGNSIKNQRITQNLHAKILMLQLGNNALLYLGSANFSRKAWRGNNQELGIVFKEYDPESIRTTIVRCLSVSEENQYGKLPLIPPADITTQDDEGYSAGTNFPGFIEMIVLMPNQDCSQVQFKFELGERPPDDKGFSLEDYVVHWAGIELQIAKLHSQWIDRQDFQNRLVGARNLSFRIPTDKEQVYWFPFQYEGDLIAERETFLHPSSWDWMNFYLNPNQNPTYEPNEYIPGEENESRDSDKPEVDSIIREENCVIAMQGYLTLFSRVENDFYKRITDINSSAPEHRSRLLKQQVIDPLSAFSRLLEREATDAIHKGNSREIAQADVFKMGELLLLINSLKGMMPTNMQLAFVPLQTQTKTILKGWYGSNKLRMEYLNFVIKEEVL